MQMREVAWPPALLDATPCYGMLVLKCMVLLESNWIRSKIITGSIWNRWTRLCQIWYFLMLGICLSYTKFSCYHCLHHTDNQLQLACNCLKCISFCRFGIWNVMQTTDMTNWSTMPSILTAYLYFVFILKLLFIRLFSLLPVVLVTRLQCVISNGSQSISALAATLFFYFCCACILRRMYPVRNAFRWGVRCRIPRIWYPARNPLPDTLTHFE